MEESQDYQVSATTAVRFCSAEENKKHLKLIKVTWLDNEGNEVVQWCYSRRFVVARNSSGRIATPMVEFPNNRTWKEFADRRKY